ncbi:MAG: carboxypeptidase regulatory-like domain-containing protein [Burkholderiaceae bacterium]|nr:carboxypeptidase regulatory-like domain-containing protein [Burkholderiaceae bacterium]
MNHPSWMGFTRTALSAAVAIVVAAPALAQNTTSAIGGRVTNAAGQPVAGATVSILHVESKSTSTTTTDSDGRWAARGLRVGGPYTVTIVQGSQRDVRDNLFLTLAETASLDTTLGAAQVTITGQALSSTFNRSNIGAGTNISNAQLNALASINRNLQDYARTDPRLAQTDKERGEISAGGQNTRYNSITIDGVNINDTFGLESNNLPTRKQPISIDAIQSVQVNLSNYDVTQKGYTGANINAITKSGTNEFHGSAYYVWRDDSLTGDRYNRSNGTYFATPTFEEDTKGFTLGGPILKDKLFFFTSYEEQKSTKTRPAFGPLGSSLTNVGITQTAIDQAISIAKSTWGFDAGTSTVPDTVALEVKDTLLKLDWNINDNHRANLRYTKTEQVEPFLTGYSATGLSLSSYWYNQSKVIESVVGQWFADWSPSLSTELKVSQRNYESAPTPVNGVRLPAIGLRFSGALPADAPSGTSANNRFLNLGTERSRHFNVLETETTDLYFGATLTRGAHELKAGVDYSDNKVYNAFLQDTNGNYTFGCEPGSYSFGTVASCTGNYTPTGSTTAVAMTSTLRDLAVLENFQRGKASAYSVQLPLSGKTLNDGVAVWSYQNTGLFLQDNWKFSKDLTLTLGLRVDQQSVPDKPIYNAAAAAPTVAGSVSGSTVVRNTGGFGLNNSETLDGNVLWQPRFGFNWNLGGDLRKQLRGGFGLFQGAAANVWLSNPFSNTGMAVGTYSCTSYSNCASVTFSPNPDGQPVVAGTPPAPNLDFVSSDLQQPSVWKMNLGFESELPSVPMLGKLVASAEWLRVQNKTGIFYQHLNLGGATATGPDGRQLFYTPQTYSQDCWTGSSFSTSGACAGSRVKALSNASFNNVYLARKTSEGSSDAVTLSIGRPLTAGFGWNLAYTRTDAKEISPLTSSTSGSNWGNRSVFNPNEEVLQNSNYLVKDRVSASMTWAKAFVGSYKTTVGVFYEGRKGKPYSWTFINDMNGDGQSGNDLMYIPSAPGSGEVVFRGGATEEARFWEIVNANPGLASAKGGVVGRNNNYAPWVNNFDVRVSQELPGFTKAHKASVTLDFLNFGNMLNKKWGRIDEITFPSNRSFVNFNGLSNGKYVYSLGSLEDYATRQESGESQWAVQVTLRYEF